MTTKEAILGSNDVSIDRWPDTKSLILKSMDEFAKQHSLSFSIFRDEYKAEEQRKLKAHIEKYGHITFRGLFDEAIYDLFIESLNDKSND